MAYCDVGGDPIGPVPDWTASVNTQYSLPLGSLTGYGRALYTYTGEWETRVGEFGDFHTFDLFLGIGGERWNVELFARNLFDEEALLAATTATQTVRGQPTGYGERYPMGSRRVGLSASFRW